MMRRFDLRIAWGVFLMAAGAMALLQNFNILTGALNLVWAFLPGLAGVFFLYTYASNPTNWWALIPGIILLALTALVALGVTAPALAEAWGGPLFLGGIGLSFWAVYLAKREHWWAIIPGGVLLTLAAVASMETVFRRTEQRVETGGIFFIGLGLTFALVGLLPSPRGPRSVRWAFIPALVLLIMGVLIFAAAQQLINYLWPAALILVGLYLVFRTFRPRPSE